MSETIHINGKDYNSDDLPNEILQLVMYYQKWEIEKKSLQDEVVKLDAAMRAVAQELVTRIDKLGNE